MKIFLSTVLILIAAKLRGKLPAGNKYKLFRVDYYNKKLPISNWSFLSHNGTLDDNGDFPCTHVVNSNGIWDGKKGEHIVLW